MTLPRNALHGSLSAFLALILCADGRAPLRSAAEPDASPEAIEALQRQFEQVAKRAAPYGEVAEGAEDSALDERDQMQTEPSTSGWRQVGNAPLYANDPAYNDLIDGVSSLGWVNLSARVTSFAADPAQPGRYFASVAGGGVWQSLDGGKSWRSVGDRLRTQVVGAIAWSPYRGGTLVAGTGDNAMAGGWASTRRGT